MPLIRIERVSGDSVIEAQEFQSTTPEYAREDDGTLTLHFRTDEGHPSLTLMLDPSSPDGDILRTALAA